MQTKFKQALVASMLVVSVALAASPAYAAAGDGTTELAIVSDTFEAFIPKLAIGIAAMVSASLAFGFAVWGIPELIGLGKKAYKKARSG